MKPIDDKKETVTFRAKSRDEEGRKRVEKIEVDTHKVETSRHIEKKLIDKGIHRKDRHPVDGRPLTKLPKSGHGGKYTWEGPDEEGELEPAPPAIDENDPNYVDEVAEEKILGEVSGVVGEVEVPKLAEKGVARFDVDPKLQANF